VGPGGGHRRVGGRGRLAGRHLRAGGEFRFAVLLAEAATARFVSGDGYLSNRQLATDLRHGAAWLATGALLREPGAYSIWHRLYCRHQLGFQSPRDRDRRV
jgi:hypothetical protein